MLDRINNIALNLSGSKADLYTPVFKQKKHGGRNKHSGGDNLSRSEALQFLLEQDWHIAEILFPAEKKITITFVVSDLEFNTTIGFGELNQLSELTYNISSVKKTKSNLKKLTAIVAIDASEKKISGDDIDKELKALKLLMKRLFELNISNILSYEDSNVLNNIYDDIIEEVYFNLCYISICLFTFINKLTGEKIYFSPEVTEAEITLLKIKLENLP